jgi:hypothetical protein
MYPQSLTANVQIRGSECVYRWAGETRLRARVRRFVFEPIKPFRLRRSFGAYAGTLRQRFQQVAVASLPASNGLGRQHRALTRKLLLAGAGELQTGAANQTRLNAKDCRITSILCFSPHARLSYQRRPHRGRLRLARRRISSNTTAPINALMISAIMPAPR